MSTTPRIIAATASAALLAATGAGAAVFAVETVTADQADATSAQQSSADLKAPQDDRTTVYRSPGDGWSQEQLQQAPGSTSWGNDSSAGQQQQQPQQWKTPNKAGKSHSS